MLHQKLRLSVLCRSRTLGGKLRISYCAWFFLAIVGVAALTAGLLSLWSQRRQSYLPASQTEATYDLRLVQTYLYPPSLQPYNLTNPAKDSSRGQGHYVRKILNEMVSTSSYFVVNKRNGFFVEAGAYDEETFSNTLFLEKELNWTGLLVEADPKLYSKMILKHRKSWTSPCCLATQGRMHKVNFTTYSVNAMAGGISSDNWSPSNPTGQRNTEVQCIPLHLLLDAIGVTTVDYFCLDVEGSELNVLRTIPFDQMHIKVLSIEYNLIHGIDTWSTGAQDLLDFLNSRDYQLVGISPSKVNADHDVVFVHKSVLNGYNI